MIFCFALCIGVVVGFSGFVGLGGWQVFALNLIAFPPQEKHNPDDKKFFFLAVGVGLVWVPAT